MATPKSQTLEDITATTNILVTSIRDYARSQQELWQKVPWLALEADKRTFHNDHYEQAYRTGYWPIPHIADDYSIIVDLATGELLDAQAASGGDRYYYTRPTLKIGEIIPAEDDDVLELALHIEDLDATKTIRHLEEVARKPYRPGYSPKRQEAWQAKMREKYHLQEEYVRNPPKGA